MFQVGSLCYHTEAAAAAASASSQLGSIVTRAGELYSVNVTAVTSNSITYAFSPLSGGVAFSQTTAYTPQPCGLLTPGDALELSWMVAAAWIAAYAVIFLARVFRQTEGPQDV